MLVCLPAMIVGEPGMPFCLFMVTTLMMQRRLMVVCGSQGMMLRRLHMMLGCRMFVLGFLFHGPHSSRYFSRYTIAVYIYSSMIVA